MCPDHEILSAYLDGEILAPWNKGIQAHVQICPSCASVVESYSKLKTRLVSSPEPDSVEVYERVFAKIRDRVVFAKKTRARIALPVPLASAAAAAFIAVSILLVSSWKQNELLKMALFSSNEAIAPTSVPVGMESLMKYLDQQNATVTINVQLPGGTALDQHGSPVIMSATGADE